MAQAKHDSIFSAAQRIQKREKALAKIAAGFGIETLETRNSDSLDFHDVSTWSISAMLDAAYKAGQDACPECDRKAGIRRRLTNG